MNLRVSYLVPLIFLFCISTVMADNICPGGGNVSWADFVNLNSAYFGTFTSCHIGNLDFSGFAYADSSSNGVGTGPAANTIGVQLVTTPLDEGFSFSPIQLSASSNGTTMEDADLSFTVTDTAGALINDLDITFNGAGSGTGSADFSEKYCFGPSYTTCGSFAVANPVPPLDNYNVTAFSPVSSLQITKDFSVSSGTNGSASISSGGNQFSQIPEPRAVALVAFLLIGLVATLRKRHIVRA